MANSLTEEAVIQIESVRSECANILDSLEQFCPADNNGDYPDTFRLLATPMLYSVWERCFTTCHAVTLRLLRDETRRVSDLSPSQRAAWLLHAPFYQRFCAQLRNNNLGLDPSKEVKKGQFNATVGFLSSLEQWGDSPINPGIDSDEIVMTFSNVNPEVVDVNSQAVGIDSYENFRKLKFGRLHNLVGIRNSIGHGAIVAPPSNDEFRELWKYTEDLVGDYCMVFTSWINEQHAAALSQCSAQWIEC